MGKNITTWCSKLISKKFCCDNYDTNIIIWIYLDIVDYNNYDYVNEFIKHPPNDDSIILSYKLDKCDIESLIYFSFIDKDENLIPKSEYNTIISASDSHMYKIWHDAIIDATYLMFKNHSDDINVGNFGKIFSYYLKNKLVTKKCSGVECEFYLVCDTVVDKQPILRKNNEYNEFSM